MCVALTAPYALNDRPRHAELLGYLGGRALPIESSDREHLGVGQLASPLVATCLSRLRNLVAVILRMCTQEEMGRVAARRIVAPVAHVHSLGDRSICGLERNAMRVPMATERAMRAVALGEATSGVGPASVRASGAINSAKHGLSWIGLSSLVLAFRRAVLRAVVLDRTALNIELPATLHTYAIDTISDRGDVTGARTIAAMRLRWRHDLRLPAGFAGDRNWHNTVLRCKDIADGVGRGSAKPLVTGEATPGQAPLDCRPNYTRTGVLLAGPALGEDN